MGRIILRIPPKPIPNIEYKALPWKTKDVIKNIRGHHKGDLQYEAGIVDSIEEG